MGVGKQRRRVRRAEGLALRGPEDQRGPFAHAVEAVRQVGEQDDEGEGAPKATARPAQGLLGIAAVEGVEPGDEADRDLGIGLGEKGDALSAQFLPELVKVLHDAVMDEDDLSTRVGVGVGVLVGDPAVRRPPRVSDPHAALQRGGLQLRLQVGHAAFLRTIGTESARKVKVRTV